MTVMMVHGEDDQRSRNSHYSLQLEASAILKAKTMQNEI